MKRICIVTLTLHGGMGTAVLNMAKLLSSIPNIKISMLCLDDSVNNDLALPDDVEIVSLGLPLVAKIVPKKVFIRRLKRLFSMPILYLSVLNFFRNRKFDLVISNGYISNLVILQLSKFFKFPVVVVDHAIPFEDIPNRLTANLIMFVQKRLYRKAQAIVAISNYLREYYTKKLKLEKSKVRLIHNFVFRNRGAEVLGKSQLVANTSSNKLIIAGGRFTKQKGLWYVIRVFSRLIEEDHELKLVLFGDGEQRDYLSKLCSELKLQNNVLFTGWIEFPLSYFQEGSIFVIPSLWEGFGLVLIEAMDKGLVPICTALPTFQEIFGVEALDTEVVEGTGYQITPNGVLIPQFSGKLKEATEPLETAEEILFNAIRRLLVDQALRSEIASNVKLRVREFYDNVALEKWKALISEILGQYML